MSALDGAKFIRADIPFERAHKTENSAPQFRRRFTLEPFTRAEIAVCGLGYGDFYINGAPVTEDKLIAPVSDYDKTLWYTRYDVTSLLRAGENVAAAWLGNGFYNESIETPWLHHKAPWRDAPKFILSLEVDGEIALASDGAWLCKPHTAITYNQLRSGERFDARMYEPDWAGLYFNDSAWEHAIPDPTPPVGVLRECLCEPIRECALYRATSVMKTGEDRYVFDIGQNISGYARMKLNQPAGREIVVRYAEQLNPDGSLKRNNMDGPHYYPSSDFMTDRVVSDGRELTWSPRFVYHGFRYVELTGLSGEPALDTVTGVFLHQAVEDRSAFMCSDPILNRLFEIGRMATLSNLHYMPTDCPTREKLGWANDAQASTEQMLLNFGTEKLFKKWLQDIFDAMKPDDASAAPPLVKGNVLHGL